MPNGFPNFRHDPTFDPHAPLRERLRQQHEQALQQQKQETQEKQEKVISSAASVSSERPLLSETGTGTGFSSSQSKPKKSVLKEMFQAIKPKQ